MKVKELRALLDNVDGELELSMGFDWLAAGDYLLIDVDIEQTELLRVPTQNDYNQSYAYYKPYASKQDIPKAAQAFVEAIGTRPSYIDSYDDIVFLRWYDCDASIQANRVSISNPYYPNSLSIKDGVAIVRNHLAAAERIQVAMLNTRSKR